MRLDTDTHLKLRWNLPVSIYFCRLFPFSINVECKFPRCTAVMHCSWPEKDTDRSVLPFWYMVLNLYLFTFTLSPSLSPYNMQMSQPTSRRSSKKNETPLRHTAASVLISLSGWKNIKEKPIAIFGMSDPSLYQKCIENTGTEVLSILSTYIDYVCITWYMGILTLS